MLALKMNATLFKMNFSLRESIMGCLNESALHYKGISHESREKIYYDLSLCGVAYVIIY